MTDPKKSNAAILGSILDRLDAIKTHAVVLRFSDYDNTNHIPLERMSEVLEGIIAFEGWNLLKVDDRGPKDFSLEAWPLNLTYYHS
tara:strand:+ start:93 stop:350 length:258 start_codon:yes stop_codon:yes gene_type:complete